MDKIFHYGGQALIEGVMMRGQKHLAIAVRLPTGELKVTCQPLPQIYTGRLRNIPFIRGIIVLGETLTVGLQALLYSADAYVGKTEELGKGAVWGTLALALGFAVALFFVAPLLLARFFDNLIPSALLSNLVEGVLRFGIFLVYLWSIGLSSDIKRVFAYHGAEHKAVNAYEDGAALEVDKVKSYSTAHVRCGTSFLLAVLVLSIFIFALLGRPSLWLSIVYRIVLLPAIAGIGYEFIRFSAERANLKFLRPLTRPGLALQSLTTREPDDGQLEVALSALREVIQADNTSTTYSPSKQPAVMEHYLKPAMQHETN